MTTRKEKRPSDERDNEIKQAIEAANGFVTVAADALGMKRRTLSNRLNHGELYVWWRTYKARKQLERYRARNARAQRNYRARKQQGYFVPEE